MTWQPMFGYFDKDLDLTRPELYQSALPSSNAPTSLPPFAYHSKTFSDLEDEKVWTRAWVCIGYHGRIPNTGDLLPFTVGNHGIHVQRQPDGSLKGHFNFAQHGGCRFVPTQCQTGKKTSCFYTSCGHSRDRDVVLAPLDGSDSPDAYMYVGVNPLKLMPIHVRTLGPLMFVNLDFEPKPLEDQLGWLSQGAAGYFADDLHHAHRLVMECPANWKLAGKVLLDGYEVAASAQAKHAGFAWVYPNLLIGFLPDHMVSVVLQPIGLTATLQYLDIFTHGTTQVPEPAYLELLSQRIECGVEAMRSAQAGFNPVPGKPSTAIAEDNPLVVAFQKHLVRQILTMHPYYMNKPLYTQPGRSLNAGVNARSF